MSYKVVDHIFVTLSQVYVETKELKFRQKILSAVKILLNYWKHFVK
jgi:hypothetical protein